MIMNKFAVAGIVAGVCIASPALALEHEVVIDHPAGAIAADYEGAVQIETRQTGTAGVAGRPSTLRCVWSASLSVERTARLGDVMQSRRSLSRADVARGSAPGWCKRNADAIDALVEARRETFRTAMLELVAQDRTALLAEAESVSGKGREG
jgi:hypothetical protein